MLIAHCRGVHHMNSSGVYYRCCVQCAQRAHTSSRKAACVAREPARPEVHGQPSLSVAAGIARQLVTMPSRMKATAGRDDFKRVTRAVVAGRWHPHLNLCNVIASVPTCGVCSLEGIVLSQGLLLQASASVKSSLRVLTWTCLHLCCSDCHEVPGLSGSRDRFLQFDRSTLQDAVVLG